MTKDRAVIVLKLSDIDNVSGEKREQKIISAYLIQDSSRRTWSPLEQIVYKGLKGVDAFEELKDAVRAIEPENAEKIISEVEKIIHKDRKRKPKTQDEANAGNLSRPKIKKFSFEKFLKEQFGKINNFLEKTITPIVKKSRTFDYIIFVWLLLLTIAFIIKGFN